MPTQKEAIENLIKILKKWQTVEDDSIKNTTEIIKKSDNPLVHLVMEIIRQDSVMHRRVQQLIVDHFEKKPITLNPDELADFWGMVEEHDEIEKKTIKMAEKKHDKLLEEMEKIKLGMYPYGGM